MHQLFRLYVLTLLACLVTPLFADTLQQAPNWDRSLALEVVQSYDSQSVAEGLKSALMSDEPGVLLTELHELENRAELPWPVREAALLRFMQELRLLPAGTVSPEVMAYLAAWQPKTLVPNDHQSHVGEPLYRVREAATGIENGWRHDKALSAGEALLREQPLKFLSTWSSQTDPAIRAGYLAALELASKASVLLVHQQVMAGLSEDPGLTGVAARTAVDTGDIAALEKVVRHGQGSAIVSALRSAASILSPGEAAAIIERFVETAPAEKTALAIGAWTPLLSGDSEAEALLNSLLDDDSLSSAAALALNWSAPQEVRSESSMIEDVPEFDPRIVTWSGDSLADPDDNLLSMGYPVPIPVNTPLPFDGFRSYDGLLARYQDLAVTTPWVHPAEVGTTHAGRSVWAYRMGDEDTLTRYGLPEPASLINGGLHAREWQGPEVATGIMELMVDKAGDHYFYDYLLENMNMIVIPVLNVDGFVQTQRYPSTNWYETDPFDAVDDPILSPRDGRMRRKNMLGVDEDLETIEDHLLGVDLNRNFPPLFATSDSSSPDDRSLVYHGEGALSEPETQALVTAAELGPTDRLRMYTDLHSFAQVHFWARTDNNRLTNITRNVMNNFSNHHAAFPSGRFYAFGSGQDPGDGAGFAYEYFPYELGTVAWLTEIEPRNACCWNPPTAGAEYGGVVENGHDGFILPESQIRRVREELSQSFAAVYYQMTGAPSIQAFRLLDTETGAVVFEAEWDVDTDRSRVLYSKQYQSLQFNRNYDAWLSFNKPMRWREEGLVVPFPGQASSTLDVDADILVGSSVLDVTVTSSDWLNQPGDAPAGYMHYQDDAMRISFSLPDSTQNRSHIGPQSVANLKLRTTDMTGMRTDANPATVVDWENGAWSGYEDDNGNQSDFGGFDTEISFNEHYETIQKTHCQLLLITKAWAG